MMNKFTSGSRRIIGAKIQAIVYEEWLPTLGVHLPEYNGYDALVNPGIMNVFSVAAYRYGHTVVNSTIVRMNNEGNLIPAGNILLRNAFFNPIVLVESGGVDPFLIGMATQVEQDFDCKLVHDLRNFLFGPPGFGGLRSCSAQYYPWPGKRTFGLQYDSYRFWIACFGRVS